MGAAKLLGATLGGADGLATAVSSRAAAMGRTGSCDGHTSNAAVSAVTHATTLAKILSEAPLTDFDGTRWGVLRVVAPSSSSSSSSSGIVIEGNRGRGNGGGAWRGKGGASAGSFGAGDARIVRAVGSTLLGGREGGGGGAGTVEREGGTNDFVEGALAALALGRGTRGGALEELGGTGEGELAAGARWFMTKRGCSINATGNPAHLRHF